MSTSVSGWARRSFIIGIRLCPPASTLASGPNLASSASAWSTLVAFSYSTYAGTCMRPPLSSIAPRVQCTRRRRQGQAGRGSFTCAKARSPGPPGPSAARNCVIIDRDMTLTQLNAFVLVARLGSVTAAANALGVSEPAVSQALSALRVHLGDQLVSRGPAGMTLTAGGSRLLATASQIVVLGAEAHAAVRAAQGAPDQLRLVATPAIAEFVISPLMEAFTRRFAGSVELSTGVAASGEQPVLVANRLADVAISPSVADDPALAVVTEPIFRYRVVVVTAGQSSLRGNPRQWRWLVDPAGTDPGTGTGQLLDRLGIPESMIRVFPNQTAAWAA